MTRRQTIIIGASVAALGLAVAIVAWLGRSDRELLELQTIEVGEGPASVVVGEGFAWVVTERAESVFRIDPETSQASEGIPVGSQPGNATVGGGSVWVGSDADPSFVEIDAATLQARVHEAAAAPQVLAVGGGSLFGAAINEVEEGFLLRFDLASGAPIGEPLRKGINFPSSVAFGFGSVWVTDVVDDTVTRIDALDFDRQEVIEVGTSPTQVAVGEGAVWVASFSDGTIIKIDPETNTVADRPTDVGGSVGGIATGGGFVWATRSELDVVVRIDPVTRTIEGRPLPVGKDPQGVAIGEGSVWVANQGSGTVTRIVLE